ncbi:TPA: type II toxin-antitoxin system VapC family toxin [Candidatus Bathyarchaeota archaeon]|nr:type II toxin-antitoxin system VapC family toxin [Candidatus Bathyarchaeota archaeon]
MRRRIVFDAGALALYFAGDGRVKRHFDDVLSGTRDGYVCEVNLAEFYYKTAERLGLETAEAWCLMVRRSEIRVTPPDGETTPIAARLKLKHGRALSLADCYAIALAKATRASLLTTDPRIEEAREVPTVYIKV